MRLNSHLRFNGQCETAFRFYEQILGGKIVTMMPYEGTPVAGQVPPAWRHKILHVTMEVGDQVLMGADAPPDHYQNPQGFSVTISLSDLAHAERIFRSLSEGGTVQMPMQETFWASGFGMLVDRFDVPWMINCAKAA